MRAIMKLTRAIILLIPALLMTINVKGQFILQNDTLKIQEVVITGRQISSEQPGFKFYDIDSARLSEYRLSSLTDLLNDATPLFIKNYGSGGTATSSFRGTSASHTSITWNGIDINDPMLGQSDFSLLPSGLVENVLVSFGGASMDIGNGAIGGIINLENKPDWKKRSYLDITTGTGSFGRYSGLVKAGTGTEKFQSVTRIYQNSAKNNFPFTDTSASGNARKLREHTEAGQRGFLQEIYLKGAESILSARVWYQETNRELPGSMQYGYAGEKQDDKSLRTMLTWDFERGDMEFFSTAAFMSTDLDYTSSLYQIDSWNKVNTYVLKGGLSCPLGQYTRLKLVLNNEFSDVRTINYISNTDRNISTITMSAERKKGKRFGAALLLRESLDGHSFLLPDFSAGFEYRLLRGEEHYLMLNFSRNSRIPSLNDMYYNPGGNPDLKNEYALSYEIGYKLQHMLAPGLEANAEITWFNNYIRDMIRWHPGSSWWWVADNIGSVNTSGVESMISARYRLNDISLRLDASYSWTRALETNNETSAFDGKQLAYIPEHKANASLRLDLGNLYASWMTGITGRIFTTQDNSGFLRGYTLNNLAAGVKFNPGGSPLDLRFRIENLFNVSYQTVEYYPQPGRSYSLTLSCRFRSE